MLSQCFFSLSLELVLRYRPSTLARPMPGGRARRQAAPPAPAHGGGTPAARRPPAAPQTLVASPPGPQFFGRGEPRRDCALPSAPEPRSRRRRHPPRRRHTEDPEAAAGPRRPGRLVCSCIELSPCPPPPCLPCPVFPLLALFPRFSTGKAVTLPPRLMDHQLTSCFLLFSFCVCLFKLFFFLPFSFPSPSLFCHVTGGRDELRTAGLSGCFSCRCPPLPPSPPPPLSFLHSFLGALSTTWKLERNQN